MDILKERREQSRKRRQLLALHLGLDNPEELGGVLTTKEAALSSSIDRDHALLNVIHPSTEKEKHTATSESLVDCEEEDKEEIFVDSSTFLKGTNSANPHNDYCQHFVDTGERPQNFIHDTGLANRFEEYPKLRELIKRKDELIASTNTPPMYLKCDLLNFDLQDLESKFDVIFVEPPLEEYKRTVGKVHDRCWSWEEVERLEIDKIAAPQSFLWLWCGSSDGLDAARKCMKRWGFRRCEDICWIKTNIKNPGQSKNIEPKALFQRTKEHCLMGIKGTVRRSTDGHLIHANVDIDIIIDEERAWGDDEKPVEIFHIMEHFCLGRRRLHIFARDSTIRPGWVSVGDELTSSNFDPEQYNNAIHKEPGILTGCTEEIERLRPKSPPLKGGKNQNSSQASDVTPAMANSSHGMIRSGSSVMGMPDSNNFNNVRMNLQNTFASMDSFRGGRGNMARGSNFGNRRGSQRGNIQQPRNF